MIVVATSFYVYFDKLKKTFVYVMKICKIINRNNIVARLERVDFIQNILFN